MIFTNNINPVLLNLGPLDIRWYGLFFALGLTLMFFITVHAFKKKGYPLKDFDSLAIYLFFGLILGARFGHIIFYNFEYFLSHPLEILMIWKGGLASHGAAIGVFLSYLLWTRIHKVPFKKYTDVFVLGMPAVAGFVRLGNFFNSEIIGTPAKGEYGVIFARLGEDFPRHPAQLYEGILSFLIFFLFLYIFEKHQKKTPPMFLMFLYMLLYFTGRFLIEFVKERHILPLDFPLSMGQLLSIIPILIAIAYFIFFFPKQKSTGAKISAQKIDRSSTGNASPRRNPPSN